MRKGIMRAMHWGCSFDALTCTACGVEGGGQLAARRAWCSSSRPQTGRGGSTWQGRRQPQTKWWILWHEKNQHQLLAHTTLHT